MAPTHDPASDWTAVASAWDGEVDEVDRHAQDAVATMIERLAPQPGERVLELACGPGSLGERWSSLVGPSGNVTLSDLAPGMVEVAARRTRSLPNVSVVQLDAAAIDCPDGSFDVVACRMGLMFVPEPAAGFAEIRRVLHRGGRAGVMTWGAPEDNPWMTVVGMAAMANGLVGGGPPIGPGGIFSLSDPDRVTALLTDAGFSDVAVDAVDIAFQADDVEAHVRRVASLAGPLAAVLDAATPEQHAALVATASELAAPYVGARGVELPGRALVATGRA